MGSQMRFYISPEIKIQLNHDQACNCEFSERTTDSRAKRVDEGK